MERKQQLSSHLSSHLQCKQYLVVCTCYFTNCTNTHLRHLSRFAALCHWNYREVAMRLPYLRLSSVFFKFLLRTCESSRKASTLVRYFKLKHWIVVNTQGNVFIPVSRNKDSKRTWPRNKLTQNSFIFKSRQGLNCIFFIVLSAFQRADTQERYSKRYWLSGQFWTTRHRRPSRRFPPST